MFKFLFKSKFLGFVEAPLGVLRPKRSRIIREEYEVSRRRNEDDTKELKNLIILD